MTYNGATLYAYKANRQSAITRSVVPPDFSATYNWQNVKLKWLTDNLCEIKIYYRNSSFQQTRSKVCLKLLSFLFLEP